MLAIVAVAKKYGKRRIVVYNRRINKNDKGLSSIEDFSNSPENEKIAETVQIYGVSGKTAKSANEYCFNEFNKNDDIVKIIFNVSMLREGINLPLADMVVYCEAKHSARLITQNIGRVLRRKENMSNSVIMVPIYSNKQDDAESVDIGEKFKPLVALINALRQIDERWTEVVNMSSKIDFDMTCEDNSGTIITNVDKNMKVLIVKFVINDIIGGNSKEEH